MKSVVATTWHEEILVDFFKAVATAAKCAKCDCIVWVLGTDAEAAHECADKLAAQCPKGELNRCISAET